MEPKKIFYNSITVSLPKNLIQFFVGVLLYWVIIGTPDFLLVVFAFVAFIITYSSVYLFNDIIDAEEDSKQKDKSKWKLIATGDLEKETAFKIATLMLLIGLLLSLLVNRWFFILNVILIFLNFLHSSPYTKFKKSIPKTAVNMTIIETIKFSLGWFALTSNVSQFPFWIILGLASAYTIGYLFYKFKMNREIIMKNSIYLILLGILMAGSYLVSWILYDFHLSLILMLLLLTVLVLIFKFIKFDKKTFKGMFFIEYMLLSVVIVSFVVLLVPSGFSINNEIDKVHEEGLREVEENLKEVEELLPDVPNPLKNFTENITNEIENIENLEDIEDKITEEIKELDDATGMLLEPLE